LATILYIQIQTPFSAWNNLLNVVEVDIIGVKAKLQSASREIKSKQDELAYSRRAVPRYEEVLAKAGGENSAG
jgi:hypothetical protein